MQNKLDDLSELKKFSSFFSSSEPLAEKSEALVENQALTDDAPLVEDKQYKVVIQNKSSINIKQHRFTNNLENSRPNTNTNRKIISLLKLDGQYIEINDLPIEMDNEVIFRNRHKKIFEHLNLNMKKPVEKWKFVSSLSRDLNFNLPGDLFRVLIQVDQQTIKIVLFDPHHLFATQKYDSLYNRVKSYSGCISQLFEHL